MAVRTRIVGTVWLALLIPALLPSTVAADSFPDNYDHRVADDSIQTYCLTSSFVSEEHKQVAEYAMYWLDQTTDMSDQTQSCLNYTDVWWYKADLPAGYRGQRVCAVVGDIQSVCDRSNVSIDFVEIDIGANDWEDRRKTSTHELGHSVGLNHDSESCMISGPIPDVGEQWRRYSAHDIGHINAQY